MINKNAIEAVFNGALKLKPTESCLIVTDTIKEDIGRSFFEYAKEMASKTDIIVIEPTIEHATEPPQEVAKEMLEFDVQILVTSKSLTHTKARVEATKKGARIATMPGITEEIANRCLDIDYAQLKAESNKIYELLSKTKEIRVTTDMGTDIVFTISVNSHFFGKDGGSFDYPGAFGNLPEGEIAFCPETAEGVYIVDASFPDLGLLNDPIAFEVSGAVVNSIKGEHAQTVIDRLERVGPAAYRIAELGIGLNPKAKIMGNILEDEKVIGTVHIALGNNLSFGGDNDVPLHLDGVIMDPSIYVDGKVLMEKGKFKK